MGYARGIALGALLLLAVSAVAARLTGNSSAERSAFRVIPVGDVPEHVLLDVEAALTTHQDRILETLGLNEFPVTDVKVWETRAAFASAFQGAMPTGATGYINTKLLEIRVLNMADGTPSTAVHEMAHLAMLFVNHNIPMNPPWVWESVAQYLDDRPDPVPSRLTCIDADRFPSLETLAAFPDTVHVVRVGHLLIEYIIAKGGRTALRKLIETHGDLKQTLGMTDSDFERGWHAYLIGNYSFWPRPEPMSIAEVKARLIGIPLLQEGREHEVVFLKDGTIADGPNGKVQGTWSFDEQGQMCVDYPSYAACAHWYADDEGFGYAPKSDCLLQSWQPVPAER